MPPAPRVAVIAVHGVADQKPGETAHALAALLQPELDGQPAFVEETLLVPVSALGASPRKDTPRAGVAQSLTRLPHSEFARDCFTKPEQGTAFDSEFSANMVGDHALRTGESIYKTRRLNAQGLASDARLDIYEMYWADLSRLSSGVWRILSELYQLIFHLGSLARHTIDIARASSAPSLLLRALSMTCAANEYLLVGPIAMGNLALLLMLLLLAAATFTSEVPWLAASGMLLLYNLVLGYGAWWFWNKKPVLAKVLTGCTASCLALAAAAIYAHYHLPRAQLGLVIGLALPVVLALGAYAAYGLAQRNTGVGAWAAIAGGLLVLTLVPQLFYDSGKFFWPWHLYLQTAVNAVANTCVVLFVFSMLGWGFIAAAQVVFALFALFAHARRMAGAAHDDLLRAVRTSMLCMMVSTSMFAMITISLWALLIKVGVPDALTGLQLHLWFDPVDNARNTHPTVTEFCNALLSASSTFFAPTLIALATLGGAMLFAFLPSLVSEVMPDQDRSRSQPMGQWLDYWLPVLGYAVGLIAVAYVIVILLSVANALHVPLATWLHDSFGPSDEWVQAIAIGLAASATSLIALGPALSKSLGRVRVVLDMALDVDNYFREHPRTSNPRSRIYARYAGLLRHIAASGQYDKIVIVAHSQGTVITADLLRLLRSGHPLSAALASSLPPITLVTAGSPLAQLYRARFPHLYRWIDAGNSQWQSLRGYFGLARWINIYRSGDYVGRAFWRSEPRYNSEETEYAVAENRGEMCLGAGAHTHYFDDTAVNLAKAVSRQIFAP